MSHPAAGERSAFLTEGKDITAKQDSKYVALFKRLFS
jgi:hypothetical protein